MNTIMESHSDSDTLVERAKRGDRAAFDNLIQRQRSRVEAFIRSRIGVALEKKVDVQDVFQESLLRAYRSLASFQIHNEDSVFRWLCGIAEHVILEAVSQRERDPVRALDFDVTVESVSPSKVLRRNERFDRLQSALDSLRPDYREVIFLVRLEGLPVREVAKRMKRTPHAVSNLLLRATHRLREVMGNTESLSLPDRNLKRSGHEKDA